MPSHDIGLLSTLVLSLVAAFAAGLAARSLRLPPLIGYLLAGVLVGPFTPGLTANQTIANELAEIGVALLLFNIGLHFSFKDLLGVRRIVVPGAFLQIALTTAAGASLAFFLWHMKPMTSIAIGLSLSIASTAVATRILEEKRQMGALPGRVALGWLVVQDLVVILALVLFPALAETQSASLVELGPVLGKTLLQVAGFVAVMVFGGRRLIPALLGHVARSGSRELFTLAVFVVALGIAYGSALIFGISLALGAFFAGVVIGESDMNHHVAAESVSMQQIFTILFFVSIGMLFDPSSILRMPAQIALLLTVIILGTGFLTFLILNRLGLPLRAAALVGGAFAQIGEFSFVLGALGSKNGFLDASERDLITAVALLSIVINPLILTVALRLGAWAAETPWLADYRSHLIEKNLPEPEKLAEHAVVVGFGRVGSVLVEALQQQGLPYVIIESDRTLSESLRRKGENVVFGDASREAVLSAAHLDRAKVLIVTIPDFQSARQILRQAHRLAPTLENVVRTHSDDEIKQARKLGPGTPVLGEREIAFGMTFFSLQKMGLSSEKTRETIVLLRKNLFNEVGSGT